MREHIEAARKKNGEAEAVTLIALILVCPLRNTACPGVAVNVILQSNEKDARMAHARWHHILTESQRHALKTVDDWNCSTGNYSDFLTHMHKAWHYLLHAEFHQAKIDYHYRDPKTGRHVMIDGEPKAWDLERCLRERYANSGDPVRLNAELFVALRNKVEHRYEHNLKIATCGKAQALVMNYEQEMVDHFGSKYSLADRLRFPVSLQALTAAGREQLEVAAKKLPKQTRDLVAKFEAAIGPDVLDDLRYDYRVRLVPIVGSKTDADLAIDFVKLDELTEDAQGHGRGRA
ncbi:DUF3644 domain-containing protein [Streptomyces rubiginosohelvolus]|uniref:DUF3644 domain-containing protein n=1 Tax=Streptomyces rubiginosohelvolus TaxID=67362 RepID=UPI0033ACCB59